MVQRVIRGRLGLLVVLVLALVAAVGVSGCTNDSKDSSDSGQAAQSTATAEGEQQASGGASGSGKVSGHDVALINITRACEGCVRNEKAFVEAGKKLGWNVRVIDGQGDPNRIADQFDTLVESGIDAIAMVAIDPAMVAGGLEKAKAKNIPVVTEFLGGAYDPSFFDKGLTSISDFNAVVESGQISEIFFSELARRRAGKDGKAKIAVFTGTPAIPIHRLRLAAFNAFLEENKNKVEVVARHSTDLANGQTDVRNTMDSILTANPDLDGVWTMQDLEALPTVEALRAQGLDKKVFLTTFVADTGIVDNIRDGGAIVATVDNPSASIGYQTADTLAKVFAGKPYSQTPSLTDVAMVPNVINKKNAPPKGQDPEPTTIRDNYTAEWEKEYGGG